MSKENTRVMRHVMSEEKVRLSSVRKSKIVMSEKTARLS